MHITKQLIKTQSGEMLLQKGGTICICPYQPAIPVQNSLGGLQLNKINCTSHCPHFNVAEDVIEGTPDRQITLVLSCSGLIVEHDIEYIVDSTKPPLIQ
jgi:hypothetical protein